MFDVARCNQLLADIDGFRSVLTLYDDTEAFRAREKDGAANRLERLRGITESTLPTRNAASAAFLYGDRRRGGGGGASSSPDAMGGGGANTSLTGPLSTVRAEGLSALPSRLHPLLIRGGTYEAAVASVQLADERATREARLAASLSHAPATVVADHYWESALKLSKILVMPSDEQLEGECAVGAASPTTGGAASSSCVTIGAAGLSFGLDDDGNDDDAPSNINNGGVKAHSGAGARGSNNTADNTTVLPHTTSASLTAAVLAVKDALASFERAIDGLKDKASNTIVYASSPKELDLMRAALNVQLERLSKRVVAFAALSGLAMLIDLHRTRIIGTYMLVLSDAEAWLHSMATIHHAKDQLIDPFEKAVISDCIAEERLWASTAANSMAATEEFQVRTKIIADLRQSEQEHREKKADKLSDLDPGLLLHTSEKNRRSAVTSRRFQMLQHIARQALRLRDCCTDGGGASSFSTGQRAKAGKVSTYVLGWVAEITENNALKEELEAHGASCGSSYGGYGAGGGGGGGGRGRLGGVRGGGGGAASDLSSSLLSVPQTADRGTVRSQRLAMSVRDRSFSRFVTSGTVDRVDILSRVTTEEMADQLARILLALKETSVGADVVSRRNELDSVRDYIRSAVVHPILSQTIDVAELGRILEDLDEWERANPDGTDASGYTQLIEVLRDSSSACGLSVLAGHEAGGLHHHQAYDAALTTKTPAVGIVPSYAADAAAHSARPLSSVTLFRQFTADHQEKVAKRKEAPIYEAISDCCDVLEAVQQLRVHVRIKGRMSVPQSFLTQKIEPLQRELNAILELLEAEGAGGGGEKNALVVESPLLSPTGGMRSVSGGGNAEEASVVSVAAAGATADIVPVSPRGDDDGGDGGQTATAAGALDTPFTADPPFVAGIDSNGNNAQSPRIVLTGVADDDAAAGSSAATPQLLPFAAIAPPIAVSGGAVNGGHADDTDADNDTEEETNPLILRLSAAADVAVQLLKEAKEVHGVSVPASCYILTHAAL